MAPGHVLAAPESGKAGPGVLAVWCSKEVEGGGTCPRADTTALCGGEHAPVLWTLDGVQVRKAEVESQGSCAARGRGRIFGERLQPRQVFTDEETDQSL